MKALLDWFDHRTGYRHVMNEVLYENIPGGARWRYVWGSTLMFAFTVQLITGIFLWMSYSPSSQTAWESVYYISFVQEGGWFLRGMHHFMAQLMIILLALHLLQVVIDGAYKAPREVNFWIGLILMLIVLGLSLTGYLLPWDQKGYWATKVATNLAGITPGVGEEAQLLAVGGEQYGNQTLTRFFALHAGVLPGLLMVFVGLHIWCFRRHGITVPEHLASRKNAAFWPDQVLKDAVACLAVLLFVIVLVIMNRDEGGAELGAPADPSNPYSAARPEWYFLFLFQLLKKTEHLSSSPETAEMIGALVIPGLIFLVLILMPFIGRWKLGHRFNILFTFVLLVGAGWLTWEAIDEDSRSPNLTAAKAYAHQRAALAIELFQQEGGIPLEGAAAHMKTSAALEGPELFAKRCAMCHRVNGHNGKLEVPEIDDPNNKQSAADLAGIGSREYLTALLNPEFVTSDHFYGGRAVPEGETIKDNMMVDYVLTSISEYTDEQKRQLKLAINALSFEAELARQADVDKALAKTIVTQEQAAELVGEEAAADVAGKSELEVGRLLLGGEVGSLDCYGCHKFREFGDLGTAPDLTGYASRPWLTALIHDVEGERFFPDANEVGGMPRFGATEVLTPEQIALVAEWLQSTPMLIEPGATPEEKSEAALHTVPEAE